MFSPPPPCLPPPRGAIRSPTPPTAYFIPNSCLQSFNTPKLTLSLISQPITIRVKDQTGEETFFKIKKSTKMSKVMDTYAKRKGVEIRSLRFLLDGERINSDDTPKTLELDDQDQIDCMLEQTGGR